MILQSLQLREASPSGPANCNPNTNQNPNLSRMLEQLVNDGFLRIKYDFERYPEIGKKNPALRIVFVTKRIESERNHAVTVANHSVCSIRFGDEGTAAFRW